MKDFLTIQDYVDFLNQYADNIKLTGNLNDNLLVKAGIYTAEGKLSENYQ